MTTETADVATYDAVAERLREFEPPSALALPDGSVDRVVAVCDAAGRFDSRGAFGRRVAEGAGPFRLDELRTRPGGIATNMATQCHALGAATALFGHLDEAFDLPFEAVDLGEPTMVTVARFDDGDLLLADVSEDVAACDADRLRAAGAFERDPGLVCVGNWATVERAGEILAALTDVGDGPLALDPGPVEGASADRVEGLAETLREAGAARPVAVAGNGDELRALERALDVADGPVGLREALGVEWVVRHDAERAAAAAPGGRATVENLSVGDSTTHTGGGDRFTAGFGCALATGWDVEPALGLGNACATYHVETGETADPAALREFLR